MGCNTCKQKNEAYDNSNGTEIKLVPDKVANGQFNEMNILLKLTTVVVIIAALPFILCALRLGPEFPLDQGVADIVRPRVTTLDLLGCFWDKH